MLHQFASRASLAAVAWACAGLVQAAPLNVNFENFTYSGTVTRYATEADARNQTNATGGPYSIQTVTDTGGSTRINARDGQIAVTSEAPAAYGTTLTYLSTAWYFTRTLANGNGWGNPNNTNDGFIQYYQESSPTVNGGWQPGHTQFRLNVIGGHGDDLGAARFWPAPDSGAAAISGGRFVDFNLDLSATFASPATPNGTTGWYETTAMPSSVAGTVSGIFQNDQTTDTSYNGFYRFSYAVTGPGSWAADNGAAWGSADAPNTPVSLWAAPQAVAAAVVVAPVPGPGKLALLGLSLVLGLLVAARRGGLARPGRLH
ncbi:hypothetical protein [Ottowia sp.]|uniref:hypothetical protein n=1 Tax=Ottowia sp. TaxID=1898956 RepID=UPI0039E589B6